MRININLASLNVFRNQTKNVSASSKAVRYLSSGYRIINSGDDPNGLNKSEKMRMQIRSLEMAGNNVQTGASMLQAADGTLNSMNSMLNRMRELVVQAGSTTNPDDLSSINDELSETSKAIDSMVKSNSFNGVNILYDSSVSNNANPKMLKMQSGSMVGEVSNIPQYNLSASKLGIDAIKINSTNSNTIDTSIKNSLSAIDSAISTVVSARSNYGAIENKFEDMGNSISAISDNVQSAESDIRDVDYGDSMMEYAKTNILVEAANSIMVQTNNLPQDCLRILERVK